MTGRSIALFIAAAFVEIGGAYLAWIGIKDHKGIAFVALGAMALTAYGVIAAFQPSHEFGRVLSAYGGVFIVGSLLWGIAWGQCLRGIRNADGESEATSRAPHAPQRAYA